MITEKKCLKCGFIHNKKGVFCSRKCANSRNWTEEDKLKKSISAKKSKKVKISNQIKALNNTKDKLKKVCPICKNTFRVLPCNDNKIFCSTECFKKDGNSGKYCKKSGGCRRGSGRGKSGWYKGYWCDSTWELAFVIYNLDHKIELKRNKKGFEYEFDGKKYKYYPDFVIDGVYYEVKGYFDKKNNSKIAQFNGDLIVIEKKKIKKYVDYVVDNYGKNFVELYEENPYKARKNKCLICNSPAIRKYCSRSCAGKAVTCQGRYWINNGEENRRIRLDENLPKGFVRGRLGKLSYCPICDEKKKSWLKTCSRKCAAKLKQKVDWSKVNLLEMVKRKTISQIAKDLGVGRTVVSKRLNL